MRFLKSLMSISVALLMCSCVSTSYRTMQTKLKNDIVNKNYDSAVLLVNNKKFIPEDRSILLNKLEKGTTFYLKGDYFQAIQYFTEAQKISDDLYTVSISKKIASVLNANLDNYYGEIYERSLIRFYESLIHYNLYKVGKYESYIKNEDGTDILVPEKILTNSERRNHLMASRSVIREWDSMLKSYYDKLAGKATYRIDIMAKLWGALIYEESERNEDKQIALQLYKDAKQVLFRYYNNYPTFNKKSSEFAKNFQKLPNLTQDYVEKNFVESTEYYNDLLKYIDRKISNLSQDNKDNLIIVLKENFVSPKLAKTITLPIPAMYFNLGETEFYNFVALLGIASKEGLPIMKFEVPYVNEQKIKNKIFARIYKNDTKITEFPILLSNPISDIAYKVFKDEEAILSVDILASASVKYSTALLTAYNLYKQKQDSYGRLAAIISYKASEKLIENSLKADTRFWSTLASEVRVGSTKLKNGSYKLAIYSIENGVEKSIYSTDIIIKNGQNIIDINHY